MSSNTSDSQFYKTFTILISGLVVLTIFLLIAAYKIGGDATATAANDNSKVAARIAPVAQLVVAAADAIAPAAQAASGKSVYDQSCAACHGYGVAGAPKTGDKAAWAARIAAGNATMYENAIKGFTGKSGVMPAKGGNTSLSDADVKAAVDYMVNASK